MEAILNDLGLRHLRDKFKEENITPESACLMTDAQFNTVGVTIGDATLLRSRCSAATGGASSSSASVIKRERNNLFLGKRRIIPYATKTKRVKSMNVKFFCLSDRNARIVPTTFTQSTLRSAGLSEKIIMLPNDAGHADVREILIESYPQLADAGGFELLKSSSHSRLLEVLTLPSGGYSAKYIKECARHARIYIRPIQASLDTSTIKGICMSTDEHDVLVTCKTCGVQKAETTMRQHMRSCSGSTPLQILDEADDESELPEIFTLDPVSNTGCGSTGHSAPTSTSVHQDTAANVPSTSTTPSSYTSYIQDCITIEDFCTEEEEKDAVAEAVYESLHSQRDSPMSLKTILLEMREGIALDEAMRINVNRANIWDCTVRTFRRPSFSPAKRLSVHFADNFGSMEGAVDEGGPRREFIRLIRKALQESLLFDGELERRVLSMNATALNQGTYNVAGMMVAVIIVHGGVPVNFFAQSFFEIIAFGFEACHPTLCDVSDYEIRGLIEAITNAVTQDDLDHAVENASAYISMAGCIKAKHSLEAKEDLSKNLQKFYVVDRCRSAYDSFLEGMKTLGVLDAIRKHPGTFQECFVWQEQTLTAQTMEELFEYQMSPEGSNRRAEEARTITFWLDFLLDVQDKQWSITLTDILVFATGLDRVPVTGFEDSPKLEFLHDKDVNESKRSLFPKAQTCSCVLKLPILKTYEEFKDKMEFGISSSPGFGFA